MERHSGRIIIIDDNEEEQNQFIGQMTDYQRKYFDRLCAVVHVKGGKVMDPYVNGNAKLRIKCQNKDHSPWKVKPSHIKSGTWCPRCAYDVRSFTREEVCKRAEILIGEKGGKIIGSGEFYGAETYITFLCRNDHKIEARYSNLQQGKWCRKCSIDETRYTIEEIKLFAKKRGGECLSDKYVDAWSPLNWMAPCGHLIKDRAYIRVWQNGFACKKCSRTEGEQQCISYLRELSIKYDSGQIPEIKGRYFDFIFIHKDSKFLLEFDGKQHFQHTKHFVQTEEGYQEKREVDCFKTWVPIQYGYKVIRIDYKQIDNIKFHILEALRINQSYYFATPTLYEWILHAKERYLPGYTPHIGGNCPINRLKIIPFPEMVSHYRETIHETSIHGQVPVNRPTYFLKIDPEPMVVTSSTNASSIISPSKNNPSTVTPTIIIHNHVTIVHI